MSNTLLLEIFGWNGIIVEPLPTWHEKIKKSNSRVIFEDVLDYPELSGITEDLEQDNNASQRKNAQKLEVDTISLNDLLEEYKAPT